MPTTTPRLGLYKPVDGGDDDVWGPFLNTNMDTLDSVMATTTQLGGYVLKTGDVMSGNLGVFQYLNVGTNTGGQSVLALNGAVNASGALQFKANGIARMQLSLDNYPDENGTDIGANLSVHRFGDTGAYLGSAMNIDRKSGRVTTWGTLAAGAGLDFGGAVASAAWDFTKHIQLHAGGYGLTITAYHLNYVVPNTAAHSFVVNTATVAEFSATGLTMGATDITLTRDPSNPLHATTKQYVDAKTGAYLPLAGGSVTGTTYFSPGIVVSNGAPNFQVLPGLAGGAYNSIVQTGDIALLVAGPAPDMNTLTLMPWSNSPLGLRIDGAAHSVVMYAANGIEFRNDVSAFARLNVSGATVLSGGLSFGQALAPTNAGDTSRHITLYEGFAGFSITGGTLNIVSNTNTDFVDKGGTLFARVTGAGLFMYGATDITLARDPSQAMHATTKQYVDAKAGNYVARTGDQMTGALAIASPTDANLYLTATANNWPGVKWNTTSATGATGFFEAKRNGLARWSVVFGTPGGEAGGNAGTDFRINRFGDDGVVLAPIPLVINRATGTVTVATPLMVGGVADFNSGITLNAASVTTDTDLSKHITLNSAGFGFSVSAGRLNYVVPGVSSHVFYAGGATYTAYINSNGMAFAAGDLTLFRDPTAVMHATTKQYVDAKFVQVSGGDYVKKSGDAMTGPLTSNSSITGFTFRSEQANGYPQIQFRNTAAAADIKATTLFMDPSGNIGFQFENDVNSAATLFFQATRSGYGSASVTLTASNINLTGAVTASANVSVVHGIAYRSLSTNIIGFGWDGTNACINQYVDTIWQGTIATRTWVAAGFVSSWITLTGRLTCDDIMNVSGRMYVAQNYNYWMGRQSTDGSWLIVDNGVGILTLTASGIMSIQGSVSVGMPGVYYKNLGAANGFAFYHDGAVSVIGRLDNNYQTDYVVGSWSDRRLKQDIVPSTFDCLGAVNKIPLKQYRLRLQPGPRDDSNTTRRVDENAIIPIGLIAQEVGEAFPVGAHPGLNGPRGEGYWQLNDQALIAALIGSVQQLSERVEQLEHRRH